MGLGLKHPFQGSVGSNEENCFLEDQGFTQHIWSVFFPFRVPDHAVGRLLLTQAQSRPSSPVAISNAWEMGDGPAGNSLSLSLSHTVPGPLCLHGGSFMNLNHSDFLLLLHHPHSSLLLPGLISQENRWLRSLVRSRNHCSGGGPQSKHCGSVVWLSILQCFCEMRSGL